MKKSLLALAVLGAFAGVAQAQSSVTLYGVADANFTRQKGGANSVSKIESGGLNGSRWGLRGSEDLGGGLKANFVLEGGYNIDTGNSGQGGRLFGRSAWVGLGGGFGEVRVGRQYTPIGALTDEVGPLSTKGADLFAVAASSGNVFYRTDNAVTYLTPNFGGVTAQVQYSTAFNGSEPTPPNNLGEHFGASVNYKGGPISTGVAYLEVKDNAAAAGDQKVKGLFGYFTFNFGPAAVTVAADRTDIGTPKDPTTIGVAVSAPLGPVTLSAAYALAKDTTGVASSVGGVSTLKDDANLYTVQAVYDLSKRTALYGFFTQVSNGRGSALGFNSPVLDKSSNQWQFGIRHRF